MNYADPKATLQSLMGRKLDDWGCEWVHDELMYHLKLDDGHILIFLALGVVLPADRSVH